MKELRHNGEAYKKSSFSVAARVAMQLGRESISNSIVAITELVKNAYDADAEHVSIRHLLNDEHEPIVIIDDDGLGMNETQLLNQWMVIGTPSKVENKWSSSKKRLLAGEKGLGRLGLDRLCSVSIIQTFSKGSPFGLELVIDWRRYEEKEQKIETIEHPIYKIDRSVLNNYIRSSNNKTIGTRIILLGLKDAWDTDFLTSLRLELSLLTSPFPTNNDFKVTLSSFSTMGEDDQITSSQLLHAAEWKLSASIDEENRVKFHMFSENDGDSYETDVSLWSDKIKNRGKTPQCGPLKFEMYFYRRRSSEIEQMTFSKAQIETFLEANQGIRIYRDFFRVKPYGQPNGDGDWLNLSYRRVRNPSGVTQGQWRVGYNQVVGAVYISREKNQALTDQTNREGILDGDAYYDMRAFALEAIRFFEINREDYERKKKKSEIVQNSQELSRRALDESNAALDALQKVTEEVKTVVLESSQRGSIPDIQTIENLINTAVEKVEDSQKAQEIYYEETERQKNTLSNLASLGILTSSFGHETIGSTGVVVVNAALLKKDLKTGLFMVLPDIEAQIISKLDLILVEAEKVDTFAKFALKNVMNDKRKRKQIDIKQIISQVVDDFGKTFTAKKIRVTKNFDNTPEMITGYAIDWESISINLITNAIWALESIRDIDREIAISISSDSKNIRLKFSDSGIGLEAGTEKSIFLPTFSTKRNPKGDVTGTGMGLSIVKGFIESYKGSISVNSPGYLGGAEFIIVIPSGGKRS